MRLSQHKLQDGSQFILHEHELTKLPGASLNKSDDEGPIWLRVQRLQRTAPPLADERISEWIEVSQDPDVACAIKSELHKRLTEEEKEALVKQGKVRLGDCAPSLKASDKDTYFDVFLRLKDQPETERICEDYVSSVWGTWAVRELPRRRSIQAYQRLRHSADDICTKYVHPPFSTDFALLFLPTEGLYAEIIRRPGLVDALQRDYRIIITGPTTLLALLNSLRMGFRTLAIQKRSSEVWQILGAVKGEFEKYGTILEKVQKKLQEASSTIDEVAKRRRAIDRKLRSVEVLPEMETEALLAIAPGLEASEQAIANEFYPD